MSALDAALADKQAFTGAAGDQVDRVVDAVDELVSRYPGGGQVHVGRDLVTCGVGRIDFTDLDNFAAGFPHELFDVHRREAPVYWHAPTENTPDGEGFWSVATYAETLAVLRDPETYSSVTGGSRAVRRHAAAGSGDRRPGAQHDGRPAAFGDPAAGQLGADAADDQACRG